MNKFLKYKKKVIIIGSASEHNTLGVVRSLGDNNINIYAILTHEDGLYVNYSKYIISYWLVKKSYIEILQILNKNFTNSKIKPLLLPTSDFAIKFIDQNIDYLKNNFDIPNCNLKNGKISKFIQKDKMNLKAKKYGFKVPKTWIINLNENYEKELNNIQFPCIVKPVESNDNVKLDMKKFNLKKKLIKYLLIIEHTVDKVLIQEYVQGNYERMLEIIGIATSKGDIILPGIIEKIREYPLNKGSTSFAVFTINKFDIDFKKIELLIKSLGYKGIFDLEFKFADGELYFIEINFRIGAPNYAYTAAGFNIPYTYYLDILGFDTSKIKNVKTGHNFIVEHYDFFNVLDNNLTFFEWIKSFLFADSYSILNKKDLKPFLFFIKMYVKIFLKKKLLKNSKSI
jgi:predicted ATP-grasp superfamily ATP-dependent carboligase